MKEYDEKNFFILLGLTFVVAFFALGSVPILEPYEIIYQDIAKTMLKTGEFLVVQNDGYKNFSMPPFYFWVLSAIEYFETMPDFFIRVPSAVCVSLTAFFLYSYCTKFFDERAGFWSCLVLISISLVVLSAKLAFNVPFFVFAFTMFAFCYLRCQYWLMYLFIVLCVATGGLAGIVFPVLLIFLHCLSLGKLERLFNIHLVLGLLCVGLVFSPWVIINNAQYGNEFVKGFFSFNSLAPYVQDIAQNHSFWYYFPILLIALMPWTGFLFGAVWDSFADSKNDEMEKMLFMYLWLVCGFVFLMCYPLRFVTMLWLVMPPLAVVLGWDLCCMEKKSYREIENNHYLTGSVVTFLIMTNIWYVLGKLSQELLLPSYVMMFLTLLLLVAVVFTMLYYRDVFFYGMLHVGMGILNMVFFTLFFFPIIAEQINLHEHILNLLK